jgi:hydroxymethylpyrimidine/phosphomethylpyrimidine kinase
VRKEKTALTIAGSDPTGGAGVQADLSVFQALGLQGLSVISALTAQDTSGVRGVFTVSSEAFALQLETVLNDCSIDGVKTGMFLTEENVRTTARLFKQYPPRILVIDPVIRSSNGVLLLEEKGLEVMVSGLFPLAAAVTPNLAEARAISGEERSSGEEEEDWIHRMCKAIHAMGPKMVVITGGHRKGAPIDLLYDGHEYISFPATRVSGELHGSGCLFSSALCGHLILGASIQESIKKAKAYVKDRFNVR